MRDLLTSAEPQVMSPPRAMAHHPQSRSQCAGSTASTTITSLKARPSICQP